MYWVISGSTGPISVHSTTCNKGGVRYIRLISVINQVSLSRGSKSKQSKHSDKNIFRIPRHSLLRNQIFSLISKGFYLSPSREIIRLMTLSAAFLGKFLKPPWLVLESPPPGDFAISSLSWMLGSPLGRIFRRGSQLISLGRSGEIQAYPFPCNINFPDFHCLVNPSWYQMGRGREVSFNASKCFSALSKYPLAVSLKNLNKESCINNSYRIKQYIALESVGVL